MTLTEREAIIKDVLDLYAKTDVAQKAIDAVFKSDEVFHPMWHAVDKACEYASLAMGDKRKDSWLAWHIWDNDKGEKAMRCEIDGKKCRVRTPRDLAKVIGADVEGVK